MLLSHKIIVRNRFSSVNGAPDMAGTIPIMALPSPGNSSDFQKSYPLGAREALQALAGLVRLDCHMAEDFRDWKSGGADLRSPRFKGPVRRDCEEF